MFTSATQTRFIFPSSQHDDQDDLKPSATPGISYATLDVNGISDRLLKGTELALQRLPKSMPNLTPRTKVWPVGKRL